MYSRFNLLMLKVHNLSGVSSLQFENKKFSISIPFLVFNISNLIGLFIVRYWLHEDESNVHDILVETFIIQEDSRFVKSIYEFEYQLTHLFEASLVLINLLRQKRIASFLNDCVRVEISGELLLRLQRDVTISSSFILFYFIVDCCIQFVTYFKFSFLAIAFNYVEFFPYVIMLNMLIATKNFEIFLRAALENIASDLKSISFGTKADSRRLRRLLENYQKLCGLCEEFNEVFGAQLTAFVCFNTLVFIFRVTITNLLFCLE